MHRSQRHPVLEAVLVAPDASLSRDHGGVSGCGRGTGVRADDAAVRDADAVLHVGELTHVPVNATH